MSAAQRLPATDPLYSQPLPRRPAYATGMLLDAQDFSDEQTYHRSRLAEALAFVSGGGTLAGLKVSHEAANAGHEEEIQVQPGLAVDRLGRLIRIGRPACLRLQRWFDDSLAGDGGKALQAASYDDPGRFLSPRAKDAAPAVPARAVVADVFLRFIACEQDLTPSFANGPFDALNAVTTARLQDAYELLLLPRDRLDDSHSGLPDLGPDLAAMADPAQRQAALQDAILDGWNGSGRGPSQGPLARAAEQPTALQDSSAVFLARILIPSTLDNPPQRDGSQALVDNWSRRFTPSIGLLGRWLGI